LRQRAHAAAARAHRLHLSVLQPAPDADRGGERRPPALAGGREAGQGLGARAHRQGRPHPAPAPSAVRALRRPAAARGDRPRARPTIMCADEPTGNLDRRTGNEILGLLRGMVSELGQTTVMVTHDAHAAAIADRVLFLADGEIVRDLGPSDSSTILDTLQEVTE